MQLAKPSEATNQGDALTNESSMASAPEHLVSGSQGVITKRIDLALVEGRERLSRTVESAALPGLAPHKTNAPENTRERRKEAIMKIEDILAALPSKEDIASRIGLEARASTPGDLFAALGIFGTGMILGGGLALLFAPKAGHQIRHDIAEKVVEIGEQLLVTAKPPSTSTNETRV